MKQNIIPNFIFFKLISSKPIFGAETFENATCDLANKGRISLSGLWKEMPKCK